MAAALSSALHQFVHFLQSYRVMLSAGVLFTDCVMWYVSMAYLLHLCPVHTTHL
jgi:hypothetical protein